MNVKFFGACILTASLLFGAAAQAQSGPDYASIIEQAHQKYKSNHDGKVADYIP
ncbi:glutaminase, partial [Klebsiella michiganensis]